MIKLRYCKNKSYFQRTHVCDNSVCCYGFVTTFWKIRTFQIKLENQKVIIFLF